MLQVNKKLIYLFFTLLLINCKKKEKHCSLEHSVLSRITLNNFKELNSLTINGRERNHLLKTSSNSSNSYIKISPFVYDELRKGSVELTINDSLNYTISEIKTDSIIRQTMVNDFKDCILVSYKVNDSIIYHHQEIIINR